MHAHPAVRTHRRVRQALPGPAFAFILPFLQLLLLGWVAGPVLAQQPASTPGDAVLDHLILGVGDLERGIEQFERLTGVRPVFGGAHPGRGTQNALVSLGEGAYLEILAPNREDPAFETAGLEPLVAMERLMPIGWALQTGDLDSLRGRLHDRGFETSEVVPGSRVREDGSRLEWRTMGIIPRPEDPPPPPHFFFYIEWSDPELHPSRTSPGGCSLAAFTLEHPEAEALAERLEAAGATSLGVGTTEVRAGETSTLRFELSCPQGSVVFP